MANQGYDTVGSRATNYTLAANVEALVILVSGLNGTGNAQNNDLTGNALANKLDGAGGHDVIFGGDGNDTLIGGDRQ